MERNDWLADPVVHESAEDLYENAPCGYFSTLPSGVLVRVNGTLARWLGYERHELHGRRFVDLVTPGGRVLYETHCAPLLHMQGFVNAVAYDMVRRDGSRLPVLVSAAYRDGSGAGPRRVWATVLDASERKRYERELVQARKHAERERQAAEEERERFRAAFAEAVVGMALTDADGRVLRSNPAFSRITGYGEDELRARAAVELTHPDDRARHLAIVGRLRAGELPGFVMEQRYVRKDGEPVWVQTSLSVARNAQGEAMNLVIIAQDISERRHLETERARLYEEAQNAHAVAAAANRAKDDFLAMLGHELRNPLAPIHTALQLWRLRCDDQASAERVVIERQVQHLMRLVDDLLDISRITRGPIELIRERLGVGEFVGKAVEIAGPLIAQRRQCLQVNVEPNLTVDADPVRLTQVLSNLLNNAAKYTDPAGQIALTASRVGRWIVIRVRDNGVGLSAEMLPRVFDMFVQERTSVARSQGGLGLGLAIVRHLVEAHGGDVRARSEGRGKGSEFIVRLPAPVDEPAPAECRADAAEPDAGSEAASATLLPRVLIVDDNVDAADLLAAGVRALGYDAVVAYDGASAIEKASVHPPGVALLDLGLPAIDGYQLVRELRALPQTRGLIAVAVTGYGQPSDRQRTAEAGFDAHFVKPVDLRNIATLLARGRRPPSKQGTNEPSNVSG